MKERKWLISKREEQKLTQETVAEMSSIERSYYNMIEKGKRNPSVDVAQRIANTLCIDWTFFYTNKGNDSTQKSKEVV